MKNHRIIAGALVDIMALCLVVPAFTADGTVKVLYKQSSHLHHRLRYSSGLINQS